MSKPVNCEVYYTFNVPRNLKCTALEVQRFRAGLDTSLEYLDNQFLTTKDGRYFHWPTADVHIELWEKDMGAITSAMVENIARAERARPASSAMQSKKDALPKRFLFVGGLHPRTTPANLQSVFERYGKIVRLEFHKKTKLAYVYYEDIRDAEDALNELNGKEVNGKPLIMEWCRASVNGN